MSPLHRQGDRMGPRADEWPWAEQEAEQTEPAHMQPLLEQRCDCDLEIASLPHPS